MIRTLITILAFSLITLVTSGCVSGEQLQLDVKKALSKHTEMNNYRFSGSADLALEHPSTGWSPNPMTDSLITMLTNGTLTWEGVASVEPVRMELSLKLTPHASSQSFDIPLLIQDNKLYVSIPAINEADQFYEIDLAQLSELSGTDNPLSSAQLGTAGLLFSSSFDHIINAINPKRFDDITADDAELRTISITLKQKHVEEAIDIWFSALPRIIDQLSEAGYIQPSTLETLQQKFNEDNHHNWIERSDKISLNDPLALLVKLDNTGFVRESQLKTILTTIDNDKSTKTWSVDIINRYNDINQNPAFTQPIPTVIKPFSDILELLSTNRNP